MNIYEYERAFGAADKTTKAMRAAIEDWFSLYYRADADSTQDPSQRIAYTVVGKLMKASFGEYRAVAADPVCQRWLGELDHSKDTALQLAMVGGECYLKPCPTASGFRFTVIPRDRVLIFGKDPEGVPCDIGMVQTSTLDKFYYTLLERRSLDKDGCLVIENRLFRSGDRGTLGTEVSLKEHPDYAGLAARYRYQHGFGTVGLVRMKTPMLNCVDGSRDGVSVYAAVAGLIRSIDENEAQLSGEFNRGESRLIVSRDMLTDGQLRDRLFVGLDEDPEAVGMTVFSPQLRVDAYLARKQEYLRNVESMVGLRRGMLSDADLQDRTATEITSSAGDFNLTVMGLQRMWQQALVDTMALCAALAEVYRMGVPEDLSVSVDWGNSTLYDEDKTWEQYRQMVADGLLAPEVALGWRFDLPAATEAERQIIRNRYMPK